MPAAEPGDEAPPPFRGFSSNADDTPRNLPDQYQYDAFAEERDLQFDTFETAENRLAPEALEREATGPSLGFERSAGLVLLVLLATGAGFALTRGGTASTAPAPPPRSAGVLRAEVAPPPPAATNFRSAVAPETRMATLLPSRVARVRGSAPSASPPSVRPGQIASSSPRFVDPHVSSNVSATVPAPVAPASPQPRPSRIRPSFDCEDARTRAQEMVCSDPRLAAADQRMSRAYAAAQAAGAPDEDLNGEQADWLEIREDAARYSVRALLNIYEQRTRELEALNPDGPE